MKQSSLSKVNKPNPSITPVQIIDQDEQKNKNFQLIGKMFGNLTKSINVNIKDMIKNSNSNKFAGGFKQSSILKSDNSEMQKNSSNIKRQNKLDLFTVYDQFGLINDSIGQRNSNSKGKPKYRENQGLGPSKIEQTGVLEQMRDKRREQFEQVIKNNYVNLHEYYELGDQQKRQQTVVHIKSSLQTMTLQNVEAKLQAHRRELRSVEEQYRAKKGIPSQSDYQQGLQPSKSFIKSAQNDLYKQYGKTQGQIYEMVKKNQKDDQKQLQIHQMWEQRLKSNPKLAQYNKKYQEFLVQKDAKNILFGTVRQNLFKWDKSTKGQSQKSKAKLVYKSHSRQKSLGKLNKSLQKYEAQAFLQKSQFDSKIFDQEVLASKDDKFIAKYIFAQIDVDKRGLLSKQQLLDYITKNQHIAKSYNIDMKWIFTDLDNFSSDRKGMLNREQLGIFLATFQRISHPQIKLKGIHDQKQKQFSLRKGQSSKFQIKQSPFQISFGKDVHRFRNLFEKLDINQDRILKREEFIENVFTDPDCSKVMDSVVVTIKIIQKDVNYRQMISFILDDYRNEKNEKIRKSKEYISFNRFCQYFQFPQSINLKLLGRNKSSKNRNNLTNQHEVYDIQNQNLLILRDLFNTIPRVYQDFIVTTDFVQTALLDPLVLAFQQQMCRITSVQTNLPIQTVRLTLQRMIKQADQYIDWDSVKAFLSRRGRPLDWNEQLINKKKTLRDQQRLKSINQVLKRELVIKNQFQISGKLKAQYQTQQRKSAQNNYTIPRPFNITDETNTKQNKKRMDQGQSEYKQLSKTFKAKPVNKQILQSKPELIQGRRAMSSLKKIEYKYQNYENDRVERALKRAQQKYQVEQEQQKLKQMRKMKANKIGIDLTKGWVQIVKQNKKKAQENQSNQQKRVLNQTQKRMVERLHPKQGKQKLQSDLRKIQQKQRKLQQADKKRKQDTKGRNSQVQKKNQLERQKAEKLKEQKQQEDRKRKQAAASSQEVFRPKINKKTLTAQESDQIQKAKQKRQGEQQQRIRIMEQQKQRKRKEILERQLKNPYLRIQDLASNEQILEKLYEINIFDIFIDDQQRRQFNKQHDFLHKDRAQREKYLRGMANKFKILMQKQQKVMKDLKVKQKEQRQRQLIKQKQNSTITQKGTSQKLKRDLVFNQSKALKRYRQIQQGISASQVPSQYDRYSQKQQRNLNKKGDRKVDNNLSAISQDQI